MATVSVPKLLASATGQTAGGSSDFDPGAGSPHWEVHSVVVSGPGNLQRLADPDDSGTLEHAVTVITFSGADEVHGLKLEVPGGSGTNPVAGLRFDHTGSSVYDVFIYGVEVSP